jgi:hypothetical protein
MKKHMSSGVSGVNSLGSPNASFTLPYFSLHQHLSTACLTFNPLIAEKALRRKEQCAVNKQCCKPELHSTRNMKET